MQVTSKGRWIAAMLTTLVFLLGACGTTSVAPSRKAASSKLTKVTVGVLPIIDVAPLYLGIKNHLFEHYGLQVNAEIFESGPAAIAALSSGSIQFGFSAPASEIQAVASGLPVEALVGAISQGPALSQAILVRHGSTIHSIKGLQGATIAVSALKAVNQVVIQGLAVKAGINPSNFHFIALPYPDMQSALSTGSITAAYQIEPYLSPDIADGDQVAIANPQEKLISRTTQYSNYICSTAYAHSHPTIVREFVKGMTAAENYAQDHRNLIRKILPSYTGVSSATASTVAIGTYSPQLNTETFVDLAKYMKQFGFISNIPNMANLLRGDTK